MTGALAGPTQSVPHPDRELVRRCLAGDTGAFAKLVQLHQVAVFGTALRLGRDRALAADVSNRTFFKAFEHLAEFDDQRPLRPWLVRIATNETLNELRGRRSEAAHTFGGEAAEAELEQLPAGVVDPADVVPRQEQDAAIRDAVSRLPEPLRLVVVLRYFADRSYAEIAELTGQTISNVGVSLLRARERLRRDVEAKGVLSDVVP
jgi:RNA polymerase sigma-70 factor, ECF subfamily